MIIFVLTTPQIIIMGKNTNFSGQPIFSQLLFFVSRSRISKIARQHDAERYVKKFNTYHHVVVMLFSVIEGYHSLREVVLGLLSNAHKLSHLGLFYLVRRSTLSRRSSAVFEAIYMDVQCWIMQPSINAQTALRQFKTKDILFCFCRHTVRI